MWWQKNNSGFVVVVQLHLGLSNPSVVLFLIHKANSSGRKLGILLLSAAKF